MSRWKCPKKTGWKLPPDLRLTDDMFVAHVVGRSMEPRIPAGSLCVFRRNVTGSRQGRLVLVENYGETGENRYTIKRYKSVKRQSGEEWEHETIRLEPLNPEYEAWELTSFRHSRCGRIRSRSRLSISLLPGKRTPALR